MPDNVEVKPGQVWADNDKRGYGRHLRVEEISTTDAAGRRVATPTHAVVSHVILWPSGLWREVGKRRTRIRLSRFRPTANGYRLVEDVSE